jgi:hypothetical protein
MATSSPGPRRALGNITTNSPLRFVSPSKAAGPARSNRAAKVDYSENTNKFWTNAIRNRDLGEGELETEKKKKTKTKTKTKKQSKSQNGKTKVKNGSGDGTGKPNQPVDAPAHVVDAHPSASSPAVAAAHTSAEQDQDDLEMLVGGLEVDTLLGGFEDESSQVSADSYVNDPMLHELSPVQLSEAAGRPLRSHPANTDEVSQLDERFDHVEADYDEFNGAAAACAADDDMIVSPPTASCLALPSICPLFPLLYHTTDF